jgi:hypothetical protein
MLQEGDKMLVVKDLLALSNDDVFIMHRWLDILKMRRSLSDG